MIRVQRSALTSREPGRAVSPWILKPSTNMNVAVAIYLSFVLMMSLASFFAYGWDKGQAANGGRRIPERSLHLMAFLGGWPGALLAQRQFRHKTQKVSFRVVFWIVIVLHIGLVSAVAYALVGIRQA